MVIIYIILGFIALGLAVFLFKILAMLCGLALTLGFVTWLIFDSFWTGCIIGGIITLVMILKNPGEYFDDLVDEASRHTPSSSSTSRRSVETIRDEFGVEREVSMRTNTDLYTSNGHHYKSNDGGTTWYKVS